MSWLTDAYNSDNVTPFATTVISIGTAIIFTLGLFLIVNSHFGKQAKSLLKAQAQLSALQNKKDAEYDSLTVNNDSTLNGDIAAGGNLDVTGDTTLGGDLTVTGSTDDNANLSVTGDTSIGEDIKVHGTTELGGDLDVAGAAQLLQGLTVEGDTSVGDSLLLGGAAALNGDLDVSGAVKLQSSATIAGDASFDASATNPAGTAYLAEVGFTLQGAAKVSGDFSVSGVSILQQSLTVTGEDSTTSFDGGATTPDGMRFLAPIGFNLQGTASFQGDFSVTGTALLAQSLTQTAINNTSPDFTPTVSFDGTGGNTVGGNTTSILLGTVTGLGSSFAVQGPASFQGDFSVAGTALFAQTLSVAPICGTTCTSVDYAPTNNFDATGTSTVTTTTNGSSTITNKTILLGTAESFRVNGLATFKGDFNVNGVTLFNAGLNVSAINNTSADYSPSNNFDGTGTSTNGTSTATTLLSCQLGSIVCAPSFDVENAVTSLQGDLNVAGTAKFGAGLTVKAICDGNTAPTTCTADFSPSNSFDATATNNGVTSLLDSTRASFDVAGAAALQGDISVTGTALFGSLTQTAINNTLVDFNPSNSFDATYTDTNSNPGLFTMPGYFGASFAVNGLAQLQGDLSVSGTAYLGGLTQTIGCVDAANPSNCAPSVSFDASKPDGSYQTFDCSNNPSVFHLNASYCIVGSAAIQGDMSFDGTAYINAGLTVAGSMSFDGDVEINCQGPCTGNAADVGGRISAQYIYGSGHISAAAFGISDGSTYQGGLTANCPAGSFLGINSVTGGIVLRGGSQGNVHDDNGTNAVHCVSYSGLTQNSNCDLPSDPTQTCSDVAENYPSNDSLTAGDVVTIDMQHPGYVNKSTTAKDELAFGIVSTNPGFVVNQSSVAGFPVALSGRVPVKVTNQNGAIVPGDYVTASSTPGYAMKANKGDKILGQALAAFNGTTGTVLVFVSVSPGTSVTPSGQQLTQGGAGDLTTLNVSGLATVQELRVIGTATINNLTVTGDTSVANITVNGHMIGNDDTRGMVTILTGQSVIHHDFTSAYDKVPSIVASPIDQPVPYSISPTATGFDIKLSSNANADIKFNYLVQE